MIKKIMLFLILLIFFIPLSKVQASSLQIIENGIYEIEIKIDSNKLIDISEGSTLSRANVQIWERSNVLQQRFEITYLKDEYYSIKSVKSGKVLDVDNAGKIPKTNVQQYLSNSTDAQKWKIEKTEDGYYNIISKCNNLLLTVENSSINNGSNIEVNKKMNKENQKFLFKKVEQVKGKKEIDDGIYSIATALDKNMVLDISEASKVSRANVQIWENVNVLQQKFLVKYDGNGYYTITNINSEKMLDVENGEITKGTNVQQFVSNNTDAQKWVITKTDDGFFNIISKVSGIFLEVANGKTTNGANIQINLKDNSNKQKFIFNKTIDDRKGIIDNGIYEITTKIASNMLLDVSGGSEQNGANIQIWADTNEKQQKFEFIYVGEGAYKIISIRSGKALTVSKSGTNYSANVYQNIYNGESNQLWRLQKLDNNTYYIVSCYNEKYLDVTGGYTNNGTNIRVYNKNFSDSQKFILEQKSYGIDVSHWQNIIDYKSLSESKKIDFMIIRAGQGTTIKDRQFERNYVETKKYKIPTGVYLYAKAQNIEEARNEANYLIGLLKNKSFELPIFYDIEEHEALDKETITLMYKEFHKIIKKAGYKSGLYASKYYLMYKIDVNKLPSDCIIWVASYGKNNGSVPNDLYKYHGKFEIWQYTSNGIVPGITGNVDCNVISKKI